MRSFFLVQYRLLAVDVWTLVGPFFVAVFGLDSIGHVILFLISYRGLVFSNFLLNISYNWILLNALDLFEGWLFR